MMKIAFKNAKDGHFFWDTLIDFCSGRIGFSHVELVFSDGMFFSSDTNNGDHGVRFRKIAQDPKYYAFYNLNVTLEQEATIRAWCTTQVGKKYDYFGVIGFILPIKDDKKRWFCSEICVAALIKGGVLGNLPANKISPNGLYLLMEGVKQLGKLAK